MLLSFLLLIPVVGRSYFESYRALSLARSALFRASYREATNYYAEAVRWRAPGNIFASQAIDELSQLAATQPQTDRAYSLLELRRSLFSSRSFYFPLTQSSAEIIEIDKELSQLGERMENPVLQVTPLRVSYGGQFLAQVGFFGWIAMTWLLIWRGFSKEGVMRRMQALSYGIGAAGFFIFWLYALAQA